MLTNKELYGKDMPPVPPEVANPRIEALEERLSELMDVHFMNRDNNLINRVLKGISHWKKLRDGEEDEVYS